MPTIFTIGYEQATQAAVVAALREARVEVLADIRYLPLSRRPGFSKSSLKAAVEEAGIVYRHFRDLGTPAEGARRRGAGDHAGLARVYAGQLELPEALKQMAELRALAEEKRVCLLCYERDAAECHRALLFDALFGDFERVDLEPDAGLGGQARNGTTFDGGSPAASSASSVRFLERGIEQHAERAALGPLELAGDRPEFAEPQVQPLGAGHADRLGAHAAALQAEVGHQRGFLVALADHALPSITTCCARLVRERAGCCAAAWSVFPWSCNHPDIEVKAACGGRVTAALTL